MCAASRPGPEGLLSDPPSPCSSSAGPNVEDEAEDCKRYVEGGEVPKSLHGGSLPHIRLGVNESKSRIVF